MALAIDTEKARSEFIVAPILFELKRRFPEQISLFPRKEFNVEPERGLSGFCNFLISLSPEQLFIEAPVIILVEAKNDNLQSGLGQCLAEIVAAQIVNERKTNSHEYIYGAITTGKNWKFLRLKDKTVDIDLNEYFINYVNKILGILQSFISFN